MKQIQTVETWEQDFARKFGVVYCSKAGAKLFSELRVTSRCSKEMNVFISDLLAQAQQEAVDRERERIRKGLEGKERLVEFDDEDRENDTLSNAYRLTDVVPLLYPEVLKQLERTR